MSVVDTPLRFVLVDEHGFDEEEWYLFSAAIPKVGQVVPLEEQSFLVSSVVHRFASQQESSTEARMVDVFVRREPTRCGR
jgi:hypothetical protein